MQLNHMAIQRATVLLMPERGVSDSVRLMAEREMALKSCQVVLEDVLSKLTPLQARVLRLHYGLEGWHQMSVTEISHVMIIRSPRAVEQVRRRAIAAIQRNQKLAEALMVFH